MSDSMPASLPMWRRAVGGLHRAVLRIATERATPARLGWAVFIGVVIGTSPFIGLHLLICIGVATLLRLNRAVTYLAANISIPALLPFIVFGSIQLGHRLLAGAWLPLEVEALQALDPWTFAEAWLLGSLVLGVSVGAPTGLAVGVAVARYRRRHPLAAEPLSKAMLATARRYDGRFTQGYVRGKLRADPVYRQLAERLPLPSPVVDVGCGRGQTLVLLKLLQPELTGVGIDWDAAKLERARGAAEGLLGLSFTGADVRGAPYPEAGTLLLLDVLHYNTPAEQDAMLRRAAAALRPGAHLYIRDVDAGAGWRAAVTRWQERLGRWVRLNRGATLCFRRASDVAEVLRSCGLEVRITPSWQGTPFANVLIEARLGR